MLVAGDLMLDRYWSGDVDRISPEAPVPIVRKVSAFGVPGGAANTACNVAALGARVTLFGVTGQDEAGHGEPQSTSSPTGCPESPHHGSAPSAPGMLPHTLAWQMA